MAEKRNGEKRNQKLWLSANERKRWRRVAAAGVSSAQWLINGGMAAAWRLAHLRSNVSYQRLSWRKQWRNGIGIK
jgi:hypothetical protein